MRIIHGRALYTGKYGNYLDDRVRNCVYLMFVENTPIEVYRCTHRVRFRLLFMWNDPSEENEVTIDQIICTQQYTPPIYNDNFYEQ